MEDGCQEVDRVEPLSSLYTAKVCLAIGAIGDVGCKQTEQLECVWSKNAVHFGAWLV